MFLVPADRGQKRALNPLKLVSGTVVKQHVGAGNQTEVSGRASSVPNCLAVLCNFSVGVSVLKRKVHRVIVISRADTELKQIKTAA